MVFLFLTDDAAKFLRTLWEPTLRWVEGYLSKLPPTPSIIRYTGANRDESMQLIANLAVGGSWPDANTVSSSILCHRVLFLLSLVVSHIDDTGGNTMEIIDPNNYL